MVYKRKKTGYGDRRWETEPGGRRLETVDEREEYETGDVRQEMRDRRCGTGDTDRWSGKEGIGQEA